MIISETQGRYLRMLKLKGAFNYETHPAFGRGPCSACLKESLAKNFVRQPFNQLNCPVNWNLSFLRSVVFGRESQAALRLVMPAARYFPEKESTQWPRPPSLAPSGQFTLSSPGDTPGPTPFDLDRRSIVRRGQGVRYALLAPLPLAFRRAEISALTIQAPGFCGPCGRLPQLVGTRRASETAQSSQVFSVRGPKARRRGGGHPDMRAGLDHKSSGMRSSVMGSGGHGLADLGEA